METLPTNPIVVHDVPEVKEFKSQFVYNFFTPSEALVESTGLPAESTIDPTDINVKRSRVPRYVKLTWQPIILKTNAGSTVQHKNKEASYSKIIPDNLNKIISEDFYTLSYKSLSFSDSTLVEKYVEFLNSNAALLKVIDPKKPTVKIDTATTKATSPTETALELLTKLKPLLEIDYVFEAVKPPVDYLSTSAIDTKSQINARFFTRLHSSLASSLLLSSSYATFSTYNISGLINTLTQESLKYFPITTDLPYVNELRDVFPITGGSLPPTVPEPIVIGYLIDKYDVTQGGTGKKIETIVINRGDTDKYLDSKVVYGKKYSYRISAVAVIAKFLLEGGGPTTPPTNGVMARYLIQSNSVPTEVETLERIPPPPPTDLGFKWDYEKNQLFLHWSFPANSQRDIKKFQIFRRDGIDKPFELLRIIDFDDSKITWPTESLPETTPNGLVVKMSTPDLNYVDEEFKKPDLASVGLIEKSRYIYTVCSVDAHGYTSNYGPQFEVGFDIFKNKLTVNLVSHAGAPKSYPNMYLQADAFIDSLRVSGPDTRKLKVYFMPEYYEVKYGAPGKTTTEKTIATIQGKGDYKLQFINLDMQESSMITVEIDDKRKP